MFWKLIEFGYDKEHGLWNSTTRFYDEAKAWASIQAIMALGNETEGVLLEITDDGRWDIIHHTPAMSEPGFRVVDKGFGVQTVEKDPAFIAHYQAWVALQNV